MGVLKDKNKYLFRTAHTGKDFVEGELKIYGDRLYALTNSIRMCGSHPEDGDLRGYSHSWVFDNNSYNPNSLNMIEVAEVDVRSFNKVCFQSN